MSLLKFIKMHGCANDYIYVDCFSQTVRDPAALARRLSDRHTGVGGDGVILICPSEIADGRMRMFNADGTEGNMCGNGVRCVGAYLLRHGYAKGGEARVETRAGMRLIVQETPELFTVNMGAPVFEPEKVPVAGFASPAVDVPVTLGGVERRMTAVSMGNSHCVVFVPEVETLDVAALGREMEAKPLFPEGVNTEFLQVIDGTHLAMRVWERGSGETMACGTGSCASVAAATLKGLCLRDTDIDVKLLGGTLTIRWTPETMFMTGNAVEVFTGEIEAPEA